MQGGPAEPRWAAPGAGRPLVAVLGWVVCAGVVPGTARAHGVSGARFEAPIPLELLLAGAAATVALTAAWLAVGDGSVVPRAASRQFLSVSASRWRRLRLVAAALFTGGVVGAVAHGLVGRQVPTENLATVFTWAVWIHGLALVSILVGSPWTAISPWGLAYRGLERLEGGPVALLAGRSATAGGAWPALMGFLVLVGVVENLTVVPRSPRSTAAVVAAYALAMLGGAVLFGRPWFRRADPLEALYRLLGRVSPVTTAAVDDDVTVSVRSPWEGTLRPVDDPWVVGVVVAMVYTVSFDGFVETRAFQSALFAVRGGLGLGASTGLMLYLVGFAAFVAAFVGACWACDRLGAGRGAWVPPAKRFAPTVIPIAAAYEVAHNYPFVVRSTSRALALAARPLGTGADPVEPLWWLSLSGFWASQVVLVVAGHLVAVVAAHHVAVDRYGADADVGHLPMVAVMVGYTVLSLWIVSRPVVA